MKNSIHFLLLIFLFGLFLFIAPEIKAQRVGSLDTSFGIGGILNTNLSASMADFYDLIVQPDGKIVAIGTFYVQTEPARAGGFNFVARFNIDGTLDMTFNGRGFKPFSDSSKSQINAVTLQSDGKIVVVGGSAQNGPKGDTFDVARFNSDGSFDSTFNGSGEISLTIGFDSTANAVIVQPDDKIVVAGSTTLTGATSNHDFVLVRYNTDGSLDTSFGSVGRVTTDFNNGNDEIYDALVQPDGKIVAAGYSTGSLSNTRFTTLVRYNSDGSLDPTFGNNGKTVQSNLPNSYAREVALQTSGKIIVVGGGNPPLRYNTDGMLDTAFQSAGSSFTYLSVVAQPDGKVIIGGEISDNSASNLAVARYNSDGSLDASFGSGGKVVTTFPSGTYFRASGAITVVLAPDGKIIAGSTGGSVLITRYQNDLGVKSEKKRVRFYN